jgi:hypothetical protein
MVHTGRILHAVGLTAILVCGVAVRAGAETILDFSDVPDGTLIVSSPYTSQGFTLSSTSGGFTFSSPDTGNGSPQPVGNNPFYAGADGLAAFSPATITLAATGGSAFSLLSIDLARHFVFDPAPTVTFTGTLAGGGTVVQSFSVTTPAGSPGAFQTFTFSGFTDLAAVSWEQSVFTEGLHQFGNIHLDAAAVPEPTTLALLAVGIPLALTRRRSRSRAND